MNRIMLRLETGQRWWAADFALRLAGLVLLGLCALATAWLYRMVHQPPQHQPRPAELLAGLIAVPCWCLGTSLLFAGQSLFELVAVPGRFASRPKGHSR